MIMKHEVEKDFLMKLSCLLKEYHDYYGPAEIEIDECNMIVSIGGLYASDGECIRERVDINLGRYFNGEGNRK